MDRNELKHTGGKPLYIQIRDLYRDRIISGELAYGDKLESEMEIQRQFGVSRITARQAITDLEKEGLVSRGRGKGTFVTYRPKENHSMDLGSFTEYMKSRGKQAGTSHFDIIKMQADERIAKIFQMVSSKPVYCFRRVRTVDDVAICYMLNFFPSDMSLPLSTEEYDESVYQKVIETGMAPTQASEEFTAMIPTKEICEELSIEQDTPVLCKRRRSFDEKGRVVEYSVSYYRGDLYTHQMDLQYTDQDK